MAMTGGGGLAEQAAVEDGDAAQDPPCAAASTASGDTSDSFLAADPGSGPGSADSPPGEHTSIDSLSDTDPDSDADKPAARVPAPMRIPASAGNSAQAALPMPGSPLQAQQLVGYARRAVSRSPGQSPGATADAGAGGPSAMAHSRCASVSMALAPGRKSGAGARVRRPSEGGDTAPAPDTAATHLLRTISTDDRLQAAFGAPVAVPGPGDTGTAHNSEPENEPGSDDGGDSDGPRDDVADAAERVFEDFAYKNLALLSHVNRGVSSSSGSGSPMPERTATGPAGSASQLEMEPPTTNMRVGADDSGSSAGAAADRPAKRSKQDEIIAKKNRHSARAAAAAAAGHKSGETHPAHDADEAAAPHGLERFPDFSRELAPSQETVLEAARMGIPYWLAHPTTVDGDTQAPIDDSRLALSPHTRARCAAAGIESLFAVQAAVVPVLRAAHAASRLRQHVCDLCVSAPTGSGKTLAFVIPIVEQLRARLVVRLRALVVLPTKDLARQVGETFALFCEGTDLRVGLATGDVPLAKERGMLVDAAAPVAGGSSRVDILVCTPGRLVDHLTTTPNFTLQHLEFWVMDEADRLLGEAYQEWLPRVQASIEATATATAPALDAAIPFPGATTRRSRDPELGVLARAPPRIQKLLFSATLTQDPAKIARLRLVRPQYICVTGKGGGGGGSSGAFAFPSTLDEFYATCPVDEKPLWLIYLLWERRIRSGICFTKSLEAAHRLAQIAQTWAAEVPAGAWPGEKIVVAEYSSDLSSAQRAQTMRLFKQGKISLLVCSDLVARGLDIEQIAAVVNYDVPTHMSQYTHRVGRTARARRHGAAYTLVAAPQAFHFKKMMKDGGHWEGCLRAVSPQKDTLAMLRQQYE
ncbi:ATP-dependent RNA helicase dbp6, partial [Coemansia nantahalensis]